MLSFDEVPSSMHTFPGGVRFLDRSGMTDSHRMTAAMLSIPIATFLDALMVAKRGRAPGFPKGGFFQTHFFLIYFLIYFQKNSGGPGIRSHR
jgi:hypothetical protein